MTHESRITLKWLVLFVLGLLTLAWGYGAGAALVFALFAVADVWLTGEHMLELGRREGAEKARARFEALERIRRGVGV